MNLLHKQKEDYKKDLLQKNLLVLVKHYADFKKEVVLEENLKILMIEVFLQLLKKRQEY